MNVREVEIKNVLTRTTGYLRSVTSHSLQPYRGCTFGRSLCGVGCYVRHNRWVTGGAPWGSFLEIRTNAAHSYLRHAGAERRWAARRGLPFSIFMSSSTDPFLPQEARYGVTGALLDAFVEEPPDVLVVQTHGALVARSVEELSAVARRTDLRVHVSIESDRDRLPGLPPPAASVSARMAAARTLREAGLAVVITVAPLLPIERPTAFFEGIARVADAVVIDHFIGGDGTADGGRTLKTDLPDAMRAVDPESVSLAYRDRIVAAAQRAMPGRVGVGPDGFAGRWLDATTC